MEQLIKEWRKLSKTDRIQALQQLQQLWDADEIERELNAENEAFSKGINNEPGNIVTPTTHRVYCGDFISPDTMSKLEDIRANLIFTSPPYNAGIDYGPGFDDKKSIRAYIQFLHSFIDNADQLLKTGGRFVINIRDITVDKGQRLPIIVPIYNYLCEEKKYTYRGMHLWYKGREESSFAWGSYLRSNQPSIIDLYEYVLVFQKGKYPDGEDNLQKTEFIENVIGVWKIRPVKKIIGKDKQNILHHPCPFPVELPKRVIKLYSHVGDLVIDPFAGILNTCFAAAEAGRNSLAVEINDGYCRSGIDRFMSRFRDSLFGKVKMQRLF